MKTVEGGNTLKEVAERIRAMREIKGMSKDQLLVEWKAGEHREAEAARILAPRFKGQFPCDLKVFTRMRRK